MKDHTRAQWRIIAQKALLGDEEGKRLQEEGDAQGQAKIAASDAGLCVCSRDGGVICGRVLVDDVGSKCWPCWSNQRDGKPCDHGGKNA